MNRKLLSRIGLLISLLAIAACQNQTNPAEQAAKQFIYAYYVNSDVKNALKFTSGKAEQRLNSEFKIIEAENTSSAEVQKPKFEATAVSYIETGSSSAQSVWKVDAVDFKTIYVNMKLEKQSTGFWKVVQFKESEKPIK